MLPSQILLNNLLYDTSQLAIPTDDVDPEQLARPATWDIGFIRRFMLFFGPISSVFDFATFGVMLWVFHAGPALFRIRLVRRVPGHPDPGDLRHPHPADPVLPQPPQPAAAARRARRRHRRRGAARYARWPTCSASSRCPGLFFLALAGIVVCYLALIEVGKHWFYRWYQPPATPAPRHLSPGHRIRRRAARFATDAADLPQKLTPHVPDSDIVTAATPTPTASDAASSSQRAGAPGTGPLLHPEPAPPLRRLPAAIGSVSASAAARS